MRKLFIHVAGFAQRYVHSQPMVVNSISNSFPLSKENSSARITAAGDTVALTNILAADTPLVMYMGGVSDSGYLTGTDGWGDQGFAERYDIDVTADDSSLKIIGILAEFHGTVNPSSTHTVSLNVWSVGFPSVVSATLAYSGFPLGLLDSVIVPFTHLGIGSAADTIKAFLFPVETSTIQASFFTGYTMIYDYSTLNGDTVGLACSADGDRTSPVYTVNTYTDSVLNSAGTADSAITVSDTIINVQNATQWSDGVWHDNYTDNDSLFNDLAIYPIVVIGNPTAVKGITRNNFTFFGCFPNPASNTANVRFSLVKNADVTIQVADMSGHNISTIKKAGLSQGEHILPIETSELATGNYLVIISTSGGDGIATKITVQK